MDRTKIKDAHRFEGQYCLPSAGNVLVPSVIPKERILIAKIHLQDEF